MFLVLAFATFPVGIKSQLLVDNFRDNSSQPVDPDVVKVCSKWQVYNTIINFKKKNNTYHNAGFLNRKMLKRQRSIKTNIFIITIAAFKLNILIINQFFFKTHKSCAKFLNLIKIKQNYFKLAKNISIKKLSLSIIWNKK